MKNTAACVLPDKNVKLILWTLLLLSPIIGMAVDLVAPSLPAILADLHAPATIVKDIVSIYILGYGAGNFFTGFLTDAWGRQKLLRGAIFSFILISLLPVIFPNIIVLLITRFLQGLALGSAAVLVRTTFSDIFPPEKLVRLGTLMGTMFGLGPVIGPIIGAYLQHYFGWKAGFCFFSLVSTGVLIAIFVIVPETHFNRHPLNFSTIKTNMKEVISHRTFMGLVILMGIVYGLLITFNTAGPFLIQTRMGYSPVFFGHFALWVGLVFLASTFICRALLKRYTPEELYFYLIHIFFFITVMGLFLSLTFKNSIWLVGIITALMYFSSGFLFPMSMGKGLAIFRHIAGTATATMFFLNMVITSFVGFLVSFVHVNSVTILIAIYITLYSMMMVTYWGLIRTTSP